MSATASPLFGLPPQSVPPLSRSGIPGKDQRGPSEALWREAWYLFFRNIAVAFGTAGGDLSGTYPNPTVIAIQGNAVQNAAPANGDTLVWSSANNRWEPTSGSVVPGAATIDYHTISGAFNITASVMPAPANGMLIVALTMASGAVQPTWDAADFSIAPGSLSIAVGTHSNCLFCADGSGKWMLVTPPVTNR